MKSIVVSALSGSSGKTLVTLGLIRAFSKRGLKVRAFKKGPDYIDTAWHALASGRAAYNLDPFFMGEEALRELLIRKASCAANFSTTPTESSSPPCDIAIIEGNRGLFDGLDVNGSCSTASVAKALNAPVLLVLNSTKMTRTAAALVNGCANFDAQLTLGGVIANRTGSNRHSKLIEQCINKYCKTPFLGCLPRIKTNPILERETGLIALEELPEIEQVLDELAAFIEQHLDLDQILKIANASENKELTQLSTNTTKEIKSQTRPHIGYVQDSALWFVYNENLEELEAAGAILQRLSLEKHYSWPELDGLYLPGGTPESIHDFLRLHKPELASFNNKLKQLSDSGMPIYAEGNAAWFTAKELQLNDDCYNMSGIFPLRAMHGGKKRGLGYVIAKVQAGPFISHGSTIKGHEFNYTDWASCPEQSPNNKTGEAPGYGNADSHLPNTAYIMLKGAGAHGISKNAGKAVDAFFKGNTQASMTHLYAPATPDWARSFVRLATAYKDSKKLESA